MLNYDVLVGIGAGGMPSKESGSSTSVWIVVGAVIALIVIVALILVMRRGGGRAVEE